MKKVLLVLMVCLAGCIPGYSDGWRAGQVTKFSFKGLIHKTWEGQMALGGFKAADQGVVANVWDFSVPDPEVAKLVLAAQESGKRVKLHYSQEWFVAPWRYETEYFVDKVQPAE